MSPLIFHLSRLFQIWVRKCGVSQLVPVKSHDGHDSRALCPETCGCDNAFDPLAGAFATATFGCPKRCVWKSLQSDHLKKAPCRDWTAEEFITNPYTANFLTGMFHYELKHTQSLQYENALKDNFWDLLPETWDEEQAKIVPCQGLCINDEETGRRLYLYRKEFELWASVANFENCAKHTYWHDANSASWYVRSSACEKTTHFSEDMDKQTCGNCLQLAAAHGVFRFF
eukprot:s2381_g5.t1